MNKYLIFLASSAVLASAAWAGPKMLERGDTDSDGFLSLDELTTIHSERAERRFARVDADGDGLLSSDEIAAAREDRGNRKGPKGRKGKALDAAELDTDSDGFVTLQEFTTRGSTRAQEHFARVDADGDGLLSSDEISAAREDRGNRKGPKRRKGKALDGAELDTDSDGFVTLQEFTTRGSTRAQERFARIDSNGDGLLSPEEFDEARTKYRDERRQDRRYN
ncbi:MAG: hypothetical protein KJO54_03325 [Gammaproteobacteria bacterium]|nr:hypothetical protein [Gammaproteobacteria bacterium]NNF61725.1 hypothetical protein [Gammaproteobacteria bacterium]NNM19708.1 hypothetical protein [Gammaproteobacteria bacterium]